MLQHLMSKIWLYTSYKNFLWNSPFTSLEIISPTSLHARFWSLSSSLRFRLTTSVNNVQYHLHVLLPVEWSFHRIYGFPCFCPCAIAFHRTQRRPTRMLQPSRYKHLFPHWRHTAVIAFLKQQARNYVTKHITTKGTTSIIGGPFSHSSVKGS